MQLPTQVTFRGMAHSDALDAHVRQRAEKLETFSQRITGCHVAVELPHQNGRSGQRFRVRIDLTVPGAELVITRAPDESTKNEDAYATIDSAFDEAGRRLQDFVRRQRGDVKPHAHHPRGRVKKLFSYEGYGFIETASGDEIYFNRNAVLNHAFDRMTIGSEVAFVEEAGEKGPQASTVVFRH